jgi:2-polyprenyl-6-methoxyphenol hydroxylase-like FAD-dependent oxidoreductase
MKTTTAVLIVGAGPTGLTLACELARRGQPVRVIEQSPVPFAGSRGKGLQPRTLEVFDQLGVIERVLGRGTPYPGLRAHLGPFSLPWQMMEQSERTEQVPYPNAWMVAQADTEAVLREHLDQLGVQVELGCALRGFSQDEAGVSATLEGATSEQVRVRYLIGADGGRSFVRKALGLTLHGATLEAASALVGDVVLDGLDRDAWHVWPRARLGLCPLPGGEKFQLQAQLEPDKPVPALELAAAQALVRRATKKVTLRSASWLSLYHPQARMVDRYRVCRVFLAGDAAHVHPPAGGQGLNLGVQDAQNLGWKLAAVLDGAPDTLLDSYQDERLPIAAGVLELSSALYRRIAKARRGTETKQLGTHYRDGALSRDGALPHAGPGSGGVRAGDRAPDGVTSRGRLFDVFRGTHFTVLAFGADAARAQPRDSRVRTYQVSDTPGAPELLLDRDGRIAASYQARPDSVIVIRPDGYIASRIDGPHAFALDAYLARRAE